MKQVPGPKSPAAVQTMMYLAQPEKFLRECHADYGDVFAIETVIFGPEVCIVRPELIKEIFTGDPDQLRAGEANEALGPLVGAKSVLLLDGPEHLRQRRLVMPPFHGERMYAYAEIMKRATERAIARWPTGTSFPIHPEMQRITMDVILAAIFGTDSDDTGERAFAEDLREKLTTVVDYLGSPLAMIGTIPPLRKDVFGLSPWARFQRAIKAVDDVVYALIDRRRRANADSKRVDVLTMLLSARDEEGKPMSDVELRDELITLLVAGHETTATELAWAFDHVLRAPRVLAKLAAERGKPWNERPYTDATIKEVLRISPVIPAVGRKVQRKMEIGGFEVPAGMMLVPGVWITQRLASIYPEPHVFSPERFIDAKPDPYAWLPFGGGIRRCVGMAFALYEMKVVLSTILEQTTLELASRDRAPISLRGFMHAPRGGVQVRKTLRH